MNITKFSQTKHYVDQNGTLIVIVDGDNILKLSAADTLVSCREILNKFTLNVEMPMVDSIFSQIMSNLAIPVDVIDKIRITLQDNEKITSPEKKGLTYERVGDTLTENSTQIGVQQQELLRLIEALLAPEGELVPEKCQLTKGEIIDFCELELNNAVNFLRKQGYIVILLQDTIFVQKASSNERATE